MNLKYVNTKILLFSVIVSLVLFSSGCMEKSQINLKNPQISPIVSTIPTFTTQQSPAITTSPNQTETPPVTTVVIFPPHFYGTISFGSNRSSALTEDQAWKYADAFFKSAGVGNVRSSDGVALGQKIWKYSNGSQEMVWSFQVKFDRNRTSPGAGSGGLIYISAVDGHVVDYSGYQ